MSHLVAGDSCSSPWKKLRTNLFPTQADVGFAWVKRQFEKHFASLKDSKKWISEHQFPAVLAPGGKLYLTDRHHHAAAIEWSNDEDIWEMDCTVDVVADFRDVADMEEFWSKMQFQHKVYLWSSRDDAFDLPKQILPSSLPIAWHMGRTGGFADSIWRSLAGYAGHIENDDKRCYVKECAAFIDFEWAYMMNAATITSNDASQRALWDSEGHRHQFESLIKLQKYPTDLETVEVEVWEAFGDTLSKELCHQPGVSQFTLPSGFPSNKLMGWVGLDTKMPEDPDCAEATTPDLLV